MFQYPLEKENRRSSDVFRRYIKEILDWLVKFNPGKEHSNLIEDFQQANTYLKLEKKDFMNVFDMFEVSNKES